MRFYQNEGSTAKSNAQRNLVGRTHYVDEDTLRWHKARVISARAVDQGLLFAIVTSDAKDMRNTERGFRYVIFDVFGDILGCTELEKAYRTSAQAEKAMWKALNAIDAVSVTLAAIDKAESYHCEEMDRMRVAAFAVREAKATAA